MNERSEFRARAGTLTLLMFASRDDSGVVCRALAQLDAALFDPGYDPDDWGWDRGEGEAGVGRGPGAAAAGGRMAEILPEHLGGEAVRRGRRESHFVARVLAAWLRESPTGPLRIREEEGMLAIGALAAGWSATVVHALSGAALTFEELEETTGAANRGELESRLMALEDAGLIELLEGPAGEVRFASTPWLRRGIAPLAAAARLECRIQSPECARPDLLDVGAAFLLTLPRVELPADLSGACRLGVWLPRGGRRVPGPRRRELTGATAQVESGHVVSVDLDLDPTPQSWAAGSPIEWLDAVVDPGAGKVEFGGEPRLAKALLEGLHELLYGDVAEDDVPSDR